MSKNSDYINSLDYDLDRLLALDLQPTSQPKFPNRERASGSVIICSKREINLDQKIESSALLNPAAGVIFPGAVIKQDQTLAEGRPTPYRFARSPLTLRVELPGLEERSEVRVDKPDYTSVSIAIEKTVNSWLKDTGGYFPPMRAFSSSHKSYTQEQIGISLGFGAQWGKNSATANLKWSSTDSETIVYRVFRQIYYTVVAQDPQEAGDVFDANVTLSKANMANTEPPGFVRSVDFGRIMIVQMRTSEHVSEHDAEAALDFSTGGVEVTAETKVKYESIANASSFQAIVLGAGEASTPLLVGEIDKIREVIEKGIVLSKDNLGYPISYVVADLKSARVSEIRNTTRYVEVDRKVLSDRLITVRHRGGYAAKFDVTWNEVDEAASTDDETVFTSRSWSSGGKTNPYDCTLPPFPGDARDFMVKATNDTWIAWDKHHTAFKSYPTLDRDRIVTIRGTTMNMTIED